ncbi:MAG: N-acetyltransferase [Armatimonadetes bacterium]|nr:MAG: N-acetyltransferase [Armatimonadota bacterium]
MELISDPGAVDWRELAAIYEAAGLGVRDPRTIKRAFEASYKSCFAYEGCALIGAGRAISDGQWHSLIVDVAVTPPRQGRGVGRSIIQNLLSELPSLLVVLVSVPNQQEFYRRLGFSRLTTAYAKSSAAKSLAERGYFEREEQPR